MNKLMIKLLAISMLMATGCNSGPKVIESEPAEETAEGQSAGGDFSFQNAPTAPVNDAGQMREVVVAEKLDTDRYTYLRVKEGSSEFWIAISKREVEVGQTYVFKGGLLKKNFYSQEFNRQFETLYLVSEFQKKGGDGSEAELDAGFAQMASPTVKSGEITHAAGAVKLGELFANKSKYAGKEILITGKCVKINPMIMNRNWVHIQDGTGQKTDLTITTTENIQPGSVVTLKGTIALDKDFGAGYRYDIIMEGAVVVQ